LSINRSCVSVAGIAAAVVAQIMAASSQPALTAGEAPL
jgi:hypothetical protein